jgi:hypothetical protein
VPGTRRDGAGATARPPRRTRVLPPRSTPRRPSSLVRPSWRSSGSRASDRLLLEHLGPLLVALWARYVFHERVRVGSEWHSESHSSASPDRRPSASRPPMPTSASPRRAGLLRRLRAAGRTATRAARCAVAACVGLAVRLPNPAILARPPRLRPNRVDERGVAPERLDLWHLPVWVLITLVVVPGMIVPFFLLVSAVRHLSATGRDRRNARAVSRRSPGGPGLPTAARGGVEAQPASRDAAPRARPAARAGARHGRAARARAG